MSGGSAASPKGHDPPNGKRENDTTFRWRAQGGGEGKRASPAYRRKGISQDFRLGDDAVMEMPVAPDFRRTMA